MKKYFKTYTKKSLALLMTVMMLMSCWVFVAPTQAEAAYGDVTVKIKYNLGSGNSGGNIKVSYYPYKTDGSGIDTANPTDDEVMVNSFSDDLTAGDGITETWIVKGFPYKFTIQDEDVGACDSGDRSFTLKGIWINDVSCTTSGFDQSEVSNKTKTYKYDGTGDDVTVKWDLPSINSVSLGPTTATVNIPRTGSASTSFTATVKDQYGCTYYTLGANKGSCSISPANSGITTSISDNTVTVSANESALPSLGSYNTITGKGTETVTVSCNSKTASATITYVSPDYTVSFVPSKTDADNSWSYSATTKYKGSVTYSCESSKILYDKAGHYTFECWHEGDINSPLSTTTSVTVSNVITDRTITAQYSVAEIHNEAGEVTRTDGTHHSYKCSVCGYQNDAKPCSFGAWTTSGSNHVRSCACGNTDTHTPNWTNTPDPKYIKSNATCTDQAVYYQSCSVCGLQGTGTFANGDPLGHSYEEISRESHSCTKNAEATYECSNEGCTKKTIISEFVIDPTTGESTGEYVDKGEHNWMSLGSVGHTCTEAGYIPYQCTYCNDTRKDYVEANDPAAHTWSTTESRYDNNQHGIKCQKCGAWQDGSLKDHTWQLTETIIAPTCSTAGEGTYTCTVCKATKTDTIAADGKSHVLDKATSNGDGTHSAKCKECTYAEAAVPCTNNGSCVCTICGGDIPHTYTAKQVKVDALKSAATCEKDATYYYSCSVCGKVEEGNADHYFTAEGSALGHGWKDAEEDLKSAATCEDNAVYYQKCSRCEISSKGIDDTKVYEKPNSALGHKFEANAENAVYNNDGHSYKCTRCDKIGLDGVVNATEKCSYGAYTQVDETNHKRTCSICGHEDVSAHNMSKWTFRGTLTTNTHTRSCTDGCGYTETKNCTEESTYYEATCLSDAYTEYACPDCGNGRKEFVSGTMLNHSYTGDYVYDAKTDTHKRYCVNGCNELDPNATACTYTYTHVGGTDTHKAKCSVCQGEKTLDCSGGSATCIKKAECEYCKAEYGDFAAHDFGGDAVNAGEGKHSYKCTTDGCTAVGVGTEVNATENCSGGTAYCDEKATCDKCHEKYGEVDKNNHKEANLENKSSLAPTCMQEGYSEYKQCKACNAEIGKTSLPIEPTKHKFDGKTTSNSDGTHEVHCSNENADGTAQCTATKIVDCFCNEPTVTPPTCLEGGYQSNKCDDCGYEWISDETEATGHDWGNWTYNETTKQHEKVCKADNTHIETGNCEDSQTETVVDPTCTAKGYTLHTCTLCGHTWKTDWKDALGHDYTQKIPDTDHEYADGPKTCTSAQWYWYDCSRCDKNAKNEDNYEKYPLASLYYENGDGVGHKWEGKTVTSEYAVLKTKATCTENAVYYVYCTVCGASTKGASGETFVAYGTALQHNYVEYDPAEVTAEGETAKPVYSATAATCTAKATYYKRCANCYEQGKDTFAYGVELKHNFTEKLSDTAHRITKATCNTKATYWYDCATCDLSAEFADTTDMTAEQIAALKYTDGDFDKTNHTALKDVKVKNPTCTEAGHSAYQHCDACNTDIGKVTKGYEKIAHSYTGAYVVVNETAEDGTVTYKHKRACVYDCGNYDDVTACSFSSFKQDAEKTDGKLTHSKSCACGNKITEECTANAAASCTEAVTCTVCGGTMQAAGGHKWGAWTSNGDGKTHSRVCANDATHKETENCSGGTADGCGAINCDICGQAYAKGDKHTWGEWHEKTPATCTADQVQERECSSCKTTETRTGDKATGHKYDKVEETTPATCTKDGVMTYYCVNGTCKDSYTKPINKLGHELGTWTITTEPTCKDEGVQTRYCQHSWKTSDGTEVKCDYYETQPIAADANKHVPGEWTIVGGSGNCTSGIKYAKYCQECGKVVDEKFDTIAHKWDAETIHKATCLENGYIEMKCLNCGATTVFDEKTPGFPYTIDETTINPNDVLGLVAKGSHTWRTEALEGETNYTVVDGCIVYITKDFSCGYTGKGYKYCEVCTETEDIVIPKAEHDLKTIPGSPASCTVMGYQAYEACNNCAYAETPVKIPALGHEDNNGDGKCDRCYFQMYEVPSGGSSACGCICHSNSFFISKIIYPIARFFWKLFKMNPDCSCGKKHY